MIMWPLLLAAFSLGLLGSVHCVGMCGPLVLALPLDRVGPGRSALSVALYHAGRILIYATGGLLLGILGHRVYLAGWQQGLSIGLGVVILGNLAVKRVSVGTSFRPAGTPRLIARFLPRSLPRLFFRSLPRSFSRFLPRYQALMGRLWRSPSTPALFLMGMLNGLLPCGMVYLAIAAALTSPTILQAVAFMCFFGMGTLPLLLALQVTGLMVGVSFRQQIRRLLPYVTACLAVLLILRGLNLGIPFISPLLAGRPGQVISCH